MKSGRHGTPSGQALLIAVFLGLLLALVVPLVVYLNRIGGTHQAGMQQRTQGETVARQGIAYAQGLLANGADNAAAYATWTAALAGNFPAPCNVALTDNAAYIRLNDKWSFSLTCKASGPLDGTHDPRPQPFQVLVKSVAFWGNNDQRVPVRAQEALISAKTLVAATMQNTQPAVALALVNRPRYDDWTDTTILTVHWAPMVVFSSFTWHVGGQMNNVDPVPGGSGPYGGFPRKYATGAITGPNRPRGYNPVSDTNNPRTDNQEYWSFAGLADVPNVDAATFRLRAKNTNINLQALGFTPCPAPDCTVPTSCGCVTGTNVTFNGATPISAPTLPAYIYVAGNAIFDNAAINLGGGGMYVDGTLMMTNRATGGGLNWLWTVHVASSAWREYAGWRAETPAPSAAQQWPCYDKVNSDCSFDAGNAASPGPTSQNPLAGTGVNFRGMLVVRGNLNVYGGPWNIIGGLLVGDPVTGVGELYLASPNPRLNVVYEGQAVHNLPMLNLSLKADDIWFADP